MKDHLEIGGFALHIALCPLYGVFEILSGFSKANLSHLSNVDVSLC